MISICGFEGICYPINATVAQLVEYDLAKVGVAGSSPVCRSFMSLFLQRLFVLCKHFDDIRVCLKIACKSIKYACEGTVVSAVQSLHRHTDGVPIEQLCNVFSKIYYSITFRICPISSIWQITSSPDFKNLGGSNPIPTPEGVPVEMIVPAFKVIPLDSSQTI